MKSYTRLKEEYEKGNEEIKVNQNVNIISKNGLMYAFFIVILPFSSSSKLICLFNTSGTWQFWYTTVISAFESWCFFNKSSKLTFSHKQIPNRQQPNLQEIRVNVNGQSKRMTVCTSCLKAGKVQKAV